MKRTTQSRTLQLLWVMILIGWTWSGAIFCAAQAPPAPEKTIAVAAQPAAPAPAGQQDLNALPLPKPAPGGTPAPPKTGNLESPKDALERLKPLWMPKDVSLLSLKKPVTASDREPVIGEIEMVTDGDREGGDGSFVELGPGVQWVQIDLQAPCQIYALRLWHFYSQGRVYHDVEVKVSDDASFTRALSLFNNDNDNSSLLGIGKDKEYIETNRGRVIDCRDRDGKPPVARYLRVYSNGNTSSEMNHYIEVEVYGKPAAK